MSKSIMPTDTFIVSRPQNMVLAQYVDVLTTLYQPIIGIEAYTLLMILWQEETRTPQKVSTLLTAMNVNTPDLAKALEYLEGIGLVAEYEMMDPKTRSFIYELKLPVSAEKFFRDDILSTMLLDVVGEERVKILQQRFVPPVIPQKYQDISASFNEVYQLDYMSMERNQKMITELQQNVPKEKPLELQDDDQFNFEALMRTLNQQFVDLESVRQIKQTIHTFQRLYHIPILEMKEQIEYSADPMTGKVERQILQKNITNAYRKKAPETTVISRETVKDWQEMGFSQRTIEIFQLAVDNSPFDFIEAVKTGLKGQVTTKEFYAVRRAVEVSRLSTSVINVVMYYLLVVKKYNELPQNIFDRLLDLLAQQDITELGGVWQALPQLLEAPKVPTSSKRQTTKTTNTTKKVVQPEWEQAESNKMNEAELRALTEKLKGK